MKKMRIFVLAAAIGGALGDAAVSFAGPFTQGSLVVSRVGDGSAALGSTATPVFLDEYPITGAASPTQSIALPATGTGTLFTSSGSATSEGQLSRSFDTKSLVLAGYNAAAGTASVANSATDYREVARIGPAGDATFQPVFGLVSNNARSAATVDGTTYYAGGGAGQRLVAQGGSSSTAISAVNTRSIHVFNPAGAGNTLYYSTGSGTVGVYGYSGLPTDNTQTPTTIVATGTGASPYDFFFGNATTLYVADDRAAASGGGIQKFDLTGGTPTLSYTLAPGAGLRDLTGVTVAGVTTLYGITTDNRLVSVTDTGSTAAFNVLATAGTNTGFRGVEFAPTPEPAGLALLAPVGLLLARRRNAAQRP